MLSAPAAIALNHLLRDADWARARLLPFAGRIIRFDVSPLVVAFIVESDGRLGPAAHEAEATAVVQLSGPTLARLVWLRDGSARKDVRVTGDTALVSALSSVLNALQWDVEEDLSRVIGDVAAHRLVRMGSAFRAWHTRTATNLVHSLAEYWTEEQPVIAGREAVREFVQGVDALRDDTDRLEKRIERLSSRFTQRG
jgi:ubiquinone biosynthesis accessory factor UbiJ